MLYNEIMKVLIIPGSLRKESFNKKLAHLAAKQVIEKGHEAEVFELTDIPLYNEDVQNAGLPESVQKFKKAIVESKLIVFCAPEYNYSISGVLKNAIDWGSRPYGDNSWGGKVAVVMGVSNGRFGTVRGQFDVRKALVALDMLVIPQPQLYVLNGGEAFSPQGSLNQPKDMANLNKLLDKGLSIADKVSE